MALVPIRKDRNDLVRLHRDMDDLFSAFFGDWGTPLTTVKQFWPSIDVEDDEHALTVKAEVPGCKADDIDISVHGNTLTISGDKKHQDEKKENGYVYRESSYGSFTRQINLPTEVDPAKVEATCKDGVLNITLPKAEVAKKHKIQIKGQ